MRKENMVTRTITSTEYEVMTVNTATATIENMTVSISGGRITDDKVIKKSEQLINTEHVKVVSVVSAKEVTNLYGMTETDFVKYANIIKEGGR